jgi:hypothetical protein
MYPLRTVADCNTRLREIDKEVKTLQQERKNVVKALEHFKKTKSGRQGPLNPN